MRILIDADGCPVVRAAIKIAKEYRIETVIFCDTSHEYHEDGAQTVTVDKGADSADFAIANCTARGDIVITQDYGLGAMVLSKQGLVVTQNGLEITALNIDSLLASRHASKKLRMSGKHLKDPAKRTQEQDIKFEATLRKMIEESL